MFKKLLIILLIAILAISCIGNINANPAVGMNAHNDTIIVHAREQSNTVGGIIEVCWPNNGHTIGGIWINRGETKEIYVGEYVDICRDFEIRFDSTYHSFCDAVVAGVGNYVGNHKWDRKHIPTFDVNFYDTCEHYGYKNCFYLNGRRTYVYMHWDGNYRDDPDGEIIG
ncbi:MAG: hypothetical protein LBR15_01990 [Methanobrevibacter sp.]|jgi:hypothetical protein|nr:hypothetical protein [Candidatus Methanovirga australis]